MRIVCWCALLVVVGCGASVSPATGMMAAAQVHPGGASVERKVIDTVHLNLRVDSVDTVARQLPNAVDAVKGYIADSQITQSQHSGTWTIRVPSEKLPAFLDVVKPWGVVQSQRTTAEDVTEQFIDVSARLASKRVEEERLLKLLQEGTGTLADILAVEQQLQRVRQEVEQAQGRVRYLEHATQYATVHLSVHELFGVSWSDGQPLSSQVMSVIRSSVNVLLLFGRGLLLVAVALVPWLIVLALPLVIAWRWLRRPRQRSTMPSV